MGLQPLIQLGILDGGGSVTGEGFQPPGVGGAELARPGAVHVQEAYCQTCHLNGRGDVRTQPFQWRQGNPVGSSAGVGDDDWLSGLHHLLQGGRLGDGEGDRGDELLHIGPETLVPSPAHRPGVILLDQHDVKNVPRDDPLYLLQDAIQHLVKIQGAADGSGGLLQRLGQFPLLLLRLDDPNVADGGGGLGGEQAQQLNIGRGEGARGNRVHVQHSQELLLGAWLPPAGRHTHDGCEGIVIIDSRSPLPMPVVVYDEWLACLQDLTGEALAPV